ncbi:putative urb2 npa2 family protein [Golovinomyces cichoracearum]|uniref:Putative urb2 npa2 family protein n=1 Tax=Golovinomyces cichoracearum TaxID=62708 RepID=A0A420IT79_9PEZI|nr:putative urb2 npa2 family protein [Golovinomyces cichoracearum]
MGRNDSAESCAGFYLITFPIRYFLQRMTSRSRSVQEELERLEKLFAPYKQQLTEAVRFVGVQFRDDGQLSGDREEAKKLSSLVPFKREEWLLLWLLKKLKTDSIARKTPSSWWLLSYLVESVPVRVASRILLSKEAIVEERDNPSKQIKKSILQNTLDEALENFSISPAPGNFGQKHSKKRRYGGELVATNVDFDHLPDLMDAISTVLSFLVKSGSIAAAGSTDDMGASLSAAYMKTTYITAAEKAAVTFGSWLTLCEKVYPLCSNTHVNNNKNWLAPFVELWNSRLQSDTALLSFSQHCASSILSLLHVIRSGNHQINWHSPLEKLLSQNIIIPAKKKYHENSTSDLLEMLTKPVVTLNILNVPVLFEIAIRSIRHQSTRNRQPEDEAWLQAVFQTLLHLNSDSENQECINSMLKLCIQFKVDLEKKLLQSIVLKSAISESDINWILIATIIKLDANIFFGSNEESLLALLLGRITESSLEPCWSTISDHVISEVLLPIMNEFAKARDLSGFIKLWFNQLCIFERRREKAQNLSITVFSAWEQERLCLELRKLLELSLSTDQILNLIDWISKNLEKNPSGACIILEAICGSISGQEDVVDSISLLPYNVIFDKKKTLELQSRYRWRAWRLLTHTLNWANSRDLDTLASCWDSEGNPLTFYVENHDSLLNINHEESFLALEPVEVFRSVCAAFNASAESYHLEKSIKPVALRFLQIMHNDICNLRGDFYSKTSMSRSKSEAIFSLFRCIFSEYPKTLCLTFELEGTFEMLFHTVFDLGSESFALTSNVFERLHLTADAYPFLVSSALESDEVLNNKDLIETIIDIIISKITIEAHQEDNVLIINSFAIQILNQIPLEVISKNSRERIMCLWLSKTHKKDSNFEKKSYLFIAPNLSMLALKKKIMKNHPNLYEGLEFENLTSLADTSTDEDIPQLEARLALLKNLTHLVIAHAHTNLDQERRSNYLKKVFHIIQNKIQNSKVEKKNRENYGFIAIFEAALVEFQKNKARLHEMKIISEEDLEATTIGFKNKILDQLKKLLHKLCKKLDRINEVSQSQEMRLNTIINALSTLGVTKVQLASLEFDINKLAEAPSNLGRRLKTFMIIYGPKDRGTDLSLALDVDVKCITNRKLVQQITEGVMSVYDDAKKLSLLRSLLKEYQSNKTLLDRILAARYVIMEINDLSLDKNKSSRNLSETDDSSDEESQDDFDLTSVYILLCAELRKTTDMIAFCIISETLELMLRTKTRSISQYSIDSTLGTICIICSPKSPHLPSTRPGTVFLHLTHLLRSILVHHRFRLKGHFPLVQLSMQGLLRCLFSSTSNSNTNTSKNTSTGFNHQPIWLNSSQYQLNARDSESYTRLLTLISDPSELSLQHGGNKRHNNNKNIKDNHHYLTSATDKWKRMTTHFMRFVLIDYIKWQLKFRILPEIKEQLMPGWYALLDNTSLDTRRLINADLNASGRAIFINLYQDYQKFGKWSGS